jgi:hypothetical protein
MNKIKILVVDDHAILRDGMSKNQESWNLIW